MKNSAITKFLLASLAFAVLAVNASAQGLNTSNRARAQTPPSRPAPSKPEDALPPQATAAPTSRPSSKTLDQIVAVVNNDIITRNELRDRVDVVTRTMSRQGTGLPPAEIIERQVLERMIVEKAQLQLAGENGVRIDEGQLDRAVQRVAESNNLTVQEFRDRLERDGTPFVKFRDDLRNQIMMERVRSHEVDDKVQVGEGEIDAYIAEQTGVSPDASPDVDLAQILVRVPEQASPEQIEKQRAKADDLYKQALGGADFGKLAASFSDGPEALQGGDMGFRSQDRLPQLFVDAVTPLQPGGIAAPVKSANGFHILKLIAKRGAGARPDAPAAQAVQQTHARHILIKVNEVVSDEQAKTRLEEIRQRIVNKTATFEDMARAYSNDASSSRGGDLGTLYAGDTVPEFEKAMNALKPGEVSVPVRTPFGYHLIEVTDRKTQNVAEERQRLIARQALRERKIEEATEGWLRELRDRAYVEIRLDAG